jgi:hypothetical protein
MLNRRLSPLATAPACALVLLSGCAGDRSDEGSTLPLGLPNLPLPHFATPLFRKDKAGTFRGTLDKAVYAGRASQLWGDVSLKRDCEIAGDTKLDVIAPPQHGTVEIKPGNMYAVYPEGDKYAACSGRLVEGLLAIYTPAPAYLGVDQVVLRAAEADGNQRDVTVNITVNPPPPRVVRSVRAPTARAAPNLPPVEAPKPKQAPTDPDAPVPTAPQ